MKLYPNPTSGEITIEWGDKETSKERLIQIVDMQGKIVAKFVAQAPKTSIRNIAIISSRFRRGDFSSGQGARRERSQSYVTDEGNCAD